MGWVGLGWVGLGWVGLGWVGVSVIGLRLLVTVSIGLEEKMVFFEKQETHLF